MEKQKRWQFYLILAVILLTVYNILPTVFYYSKPLKKPIGEKEGLNVAKSIAQRVNSLEDFTLSWLNAQSKNLGLKPVQIALDPEDPRLAKVTFRTSQDAALFAKTLQRAGALIPFLPAQLGSDPRSFEEGGKTVTVQRRIGVYLDPQKLSTYFHFVPKTEANGEISSEYQQLVNDRVLQLALGFAGESKPGRLLMAISADQATDEEVIHLARTIVEYENAFGDQSPITRRFYATFTQVPPSVGRPELIHKLTARLETLAQKLGKNITSLKEEQARLQEGGKFLTSVQQQKIEVFESQKSLLQAAASIVKRNASVFQQGQTPLTQDSILKALGSLPISYEKIQRLEFNERNPFVASLEIDWNKDQIQLILQPDVAKIRSRTVKTELEAIQLEKLNQFLFNEIATVARTTDESISPSLDRFVVALNKLTNSSSLLTLDIGALAGAQSATLTRLLTNSWQPTDRELSHTNYPIYSWDQFAQLPPQEQKLGLVIYAPAMEKTTENGFRSGSFYVIARGLNTIQQKYQDLPDSADKKDFEKDFRALQDLLRQNGFIGYLGASADMPAKYHNDYIFELDDYYSYLLAATREDFSVKGSKKLKHRSTRISSNGATNTARRG
jgi:SecD/SecF fusion protein